MGRAYDRGYEAGYTHAMYIDAYGGNIDDGPDEVMTWGWDGEEKDSFIHGWWIGMNDYNDESEYRDMECDC